MRKRSRDLDVSSHIAQSGHDRIAVTLLDARGSSSETPVLAKTAQLLFYDWEPNVIGSAGKPDPTNATVTGGVEAGAVQFGLPE